MSEQTKALNEHRIYPFDLTEFDQWINDASRKDIKQLCLKFKGKIFGLKMWDWKKLRDQELLSSPNFGVNLIFKNEDEDKVNEIIQSYKRLDNARIVIDQLFDLAIESLTWV